MDILGRTIKILNWILFGKMTDARRANLKKAFDGFLKIMERALAEAKNIEVVSSKDGVIVRFRKEI